MEEKVKKQNGGKRAGAGRKPKGGVGTQDIHYRIRKDYLLILRKNYPNVSEFIDKAIREKLRRAGLISAETESNQ